MLMGMGLSAAYEWQRGR